MKNYIERQLMSLCTVVALLPSVASGVAFGADAAAQLPAVMKPKVAVLAKSKTPVILPTWLPNMKDVKYVLSEPQNMGNPDYEMWMASQPSGASFCTGFYITGGRRRPAHSKRTIALGKGRTGYLMRANNWRVVEWAEGKYAYRLAIIDALASEADLLRMAKSVVTVYPAAH